MDSVLPTRNGKHHELIRIQAIDYLKHSTTISHIDAFVRKKCNESGER